MDEDGQTLLRFDNFPDHPGVDRHHYHTPDGMYNIGYTSLKDHVQTFYDEIDERLIIMTEHTLNDTDEIDSEEIVMDDAEAGFLADRDPEDYPSVLRVTSVSKSQHQQDALDRLERWKAGEEVPHVVSFQNPSDLRALLTDRRIELLESVMANQPESIRQLADRLERDVKTIHDELQVLAKYDIVHFEQADRAKRPFVPYEIIEINLEISTPNHPDDAAPA